MPRPAKHPAQFAEPERLPQLVQRPYVAQRTRRLELDRRQRRVQYVRPAGDLQQAGDDCVETTAQLIESAQRDQRAVLGLASVIAKRLDKLEILARTGTGDLEEHASTLTALYRLSNITIKVNNVPLQDFCKNTPQTRMATLPNSQKSVLFAPNCRTRGVDSLQTKATAFTNCSRNFLPIQAELKPSRIRHPLCHVFQRVGGPQSGEEEYAL